MADQYGSPPSKARDQNLSSILDTIADDGPAKVGAGGQSPIDERPHTSTAEQAYRFTSATLARENSAGSAKAPRQRAPKRRSWRRELAIAGITGTAAIAALVVLYAPWRVESPTRGHAGAQTVNDLAADLETIRASVRLLSERMDGLGPESGRNEQELDRRLSKVDETIQRRLSALEQRFERIGELEYELALVTSWLEALENEVGGRLSNAGPGPRSEEGAESGVSSVRNAASRWKMEAPAPEPRPRKHDPGDRESQAEVLENSAHEPSGEPADETPVPDSSRAGGTDPAHRQSDGFSNRKVTLLVSPPAKSDEREATVDGDASRSEMTDSGEGTSSGHWAINLIAVASKSKAQALQRNYAAKGVEVELIPIRASHSSRKLLGLGISGFSNREEAAARAEGVKRKLGIRDVWIYEYGEKSGLVGEIRTR